MPPSQEVPPVKRRDIAKANSNLDISNNEPSTASKTPEPGQCNRLIASKPPVDTAKGSNKASLLTLPVEIRLRIYDLLLVSRFDREQNPRVAVGNTNQKKILLGSKVLQFRVYRTMEPAIVQTCQQIYHEANPILYSQNVFLITEPGKMFGLIEQIGLVNLKLIKTLDIWVSWSAELSLLVQLFDTLAEEASGLRCIQVSWGLGIEPPKGGCLGENLDLVRALGKIQGLETLVMTGYFAKNWPAYLEERMGVRVQIIYGYYYKADVLPKGLLNDEEFENERRSREQRDRELNEKELQKFMDYQRGTVHLFP